MLLGEDRPLVGRGVALLFEEKRSMPKERRAPGEEVTRLGGRGIDLLTRRDRPYLVW